MINEARRILILALLTTLLAATPTRSQDQASRDTIPAGGQRILNKALQYTGFDSLEGYSRGCVQGPELVRHETDNTPFIHGYFAAGEVWLVTFKGIVVTGDEAKVDATHENARDYTVYLDPESGRLLKIESKITTVRLPYQPPGTLEERRAICASAGRDTVFLPEPIPIPFSDVLAKCPHPVYLATETVALYVTVPAERSVKSPTRWEVYLWGISACPMIGPAGDTNTAVEFHTSTVIFADPATGKTLGMICPAR